MDELPELPPPRNPEQQFWAGICARLDKQNQLLADVCARLPAPGAPGTDVPSSDDTVELTEPAVPRRGDRARRTGETEPLAEPAAPKTRPKAQGAPAKPTAARKASTASKTARRSNTSRTTTQKGS